MIRYIILGLVFVIAVLSVLALMLDRESTEIAATLSLADAIGGGIEAEEAAAGISYARATAPRSFVFPADHGPHNPYKLEWWYFTGNLQSDDGRHFGYQLTFFRTALMPVADRRVEEGEGDSSWQTNQLYTAHFALTDVSGEQFIASEKFERGAAGLAGAQADPLNVWIHDWSARQIGESTFPMILRASADNVEIDLTVEPTKPFVLQGDKGLSRKGEGEGQASYYYSFTRLATTGSVVVNGDRFEVEGLSWLDREWSTSLLGRTQIGWDWFSLQLDDGTDVMHFKLREQSTDAPAYRDGVLIDANGNKRKLDLDELVLTEEETWTNSKGDATYPSKWRLVIPDEELDLQIRPWLADQELDLALRYWEGAVQVSGTRMGKPVAGNGYVELTGYADGVNN